MVFHVSTLSDPEYLNPLIWRRLRSMGVHPPSTKVHARPSSSKRLSDFPNLFGGGHPATPGPYSGSSSSQKRNHKPVLFGRPLRDLRRVFVPLDFETEESVEEIPVPTFLSLLCRFIKRNGGAEKEGIFRLSGSEARQRILRKEIELKINNDEEIGFVERWDGTVSVLDAASLLKQWLRELPEPIIPEFYQEIFASCCTVNPDDVDRCLILATCLLPENASTSLTYLFRFFHFIAEKSSSNKMDAKNLAIVLTPSIFPVDNNNKKGALENAKNQLSVKTQIVEKFIILAKKVSILEETLEDEYQSTIANMQQAAFTSQSEDNLDIEDHQTGPSERRSRKMKKKQRRSGSLSRVFTAFKGIISRTATPASSVHGGSSSALNDDVDQTPDPFQTPNILGSTYKRKALNQADDASQLSPKYAKHSETPIGIQKVRGRTFSVKRFKRKKSLTSKNKTSSGVDPSQQSDTQLVNFSPLPSKPVFIAHTPCTPAEVAIKASKDMSDEDMEEVDSASSVSQSKDKSKDIVRRKSSDMRRPSATRKPSERKIGVIRKRSQEMATRKQSMKTAPQVTPSSSVSIGSLKRGQPNSLVTGLAKPSPVRVETPLGIKTRMMKMNYRDKKDQEAEESVQRPVLNKKDSLANLKKDINCLIESSFGPNDNPNDGSIVSSSSPSSFNLGVQDIINKMKDIEMNTTSPITRSQLRRQSSAFEFARPGPFPSNPALGCGTNLSSRRQSSAFEIGGKKQMFEMEQRNAETRASLRRKNSSVRDLIMRIENIKSVKQLKKSVEEERRKPSHQEDQLDGGVGRGEEEEEEEIVEEEWKDAAEFFKVNNNQEIPDLAENLSTAALVMEEGCKRSSIIRIRNEQKGKVSKSVETFTKPMSAPPPPPPSSTTTTTSTSSKANIANPRRLSARMGVAAATTTTSTTTTYVSSNRKPTGIRTTTSKRNTTSISTRSKVQPTQQHQPQQQLQAKTRRNNSDKRTKPRRHPRRHLTIGYEGERLTRSPLKERSNVAGVQRSKSAQTTTFNKKLKAKSSFTSSSSSSSSMASIASSVASSRRLPGNDENNVSVQRSQSLKSSIAATKTVPRSLRETIYDEPGPKSAEVRRNLSDRVVTPNKGGLKNEAVPFIKSTLKTPRRNPTPHKLVGSGGKLAAAVTTPVRKSPSGQTKSSIIDNGPCIISLSRLKLDES